MDWARIWPHGRWGVPVISVALILGSLGTGRMLGEPRWGDALMLAAAAVAGAPIVTAAVRASTARIIGIDLLVSVAAIGAILIRNYWEAAAVTSLFAIGH